MATFTINLLTGEKYLFSGNFSNSGSTTFSGLTSSSNGLTTVGHQVKLGGVLTQNTVFNGGASLFNLRYAGDYSTNFTARSLADVGYVLSQISASTPTWLTLTNIPAWLTGATLATFETGHTHSYNNLTGILSGGTGISILGNIISVTGSTLMDTTLQLLDISGGTEINTISPTPIIWTTVEFSGTSVSFTGGSKIYFNETGEYSVGYTLDYGSVGVGTKNIGSTIRINGVTDIVPLTTASFPINSSTSDGTNLAIPYRFSFTVGDYIELLAYRTGNSGSVLTHAGASWITVLKENI